ncbi:YcjF family protein [Planctomycetota bacterium]
MAKTTGKTGASRGEGSGGGRKRRRLYHSVSEETVESPEKPVVTRDAAADPDGGARLRKADYLVNKHMLWSVGAGLLPMPFLDAVGVSGVQLKMLKDLSDLYGVPFSESAGKSVIASLVGGLGALAFARRVAAPALWLIPVIGPIACLAIFPATAAAATYALSKVFIQHYELGGTLLNFRPEETKAYFREQFQAGRLVVKRLKKNE